MITTKREGIQIIMTAIAIRIEITIQRKKKMLPVLLKVGVTGAVIAVERKDM
jgi:hypothetical protein